MTWPQRSWMAWVSLLALLWAFYPLLASQARGVVILACVSGALACLGLLLGFSLCVVWSAGLGVLNLTLALLLSAPPTSLWFGLNAGLLLLGLLDGQQSLLSIRHSQVEPGVITAFLKAFLHLSILSLAAGLGLGVLVLQLSFQQVAATAAGYMTILGAGLFVGFFAAFLLLTSRWTALQRPPQTPEKSD